MESTETSAPARSSSRCSDGWIGTRELPAFRAGNIVVSLCDLPQIDGDHLYLDVLLLDGDGMTEDNQSGPCFAVSRLDTLTDRARFVSVVAEMLRHTSIDERGLSPVGQALRFIREAGVRLESLTVAIQLLDEACSDDVVTRSLDDVLSSSLGHARAHRVMSAVVTKLALASTPHASRPPRDRGADVEIVNRGGVPAQLAFVIATVGKSRARSFLRTMTTLKMVPEPARFEPRNLLAVDRAATWGKTGSAGRPHP